MKLKQKSPQITRNYKLAKSSPANQSTDKPYFFAVVASIFLTSSSGSNSAPKYNAKSPVAGTVALVKNWLIVEIRGEEKTKLIVGFFANASLAMVASSPSVKSRPHSVSSTAGVFTPAEGSISYAWPLQMSNNASPS